MSALYHFNAAASEVLELFLESAAPSFSTTGTIFTTR